MGGGVSVEDAMSKANAATDGYLDETRVREIVGDAFDQSTFDELAVEGIIRVSILRQKIQEHQNADGNSSGAPAVRSSFLAGLSSSLGMTLYNVEDEKKPKKNRNNKDEKKIKNGTKTCGVLAAEVADILADDSDDDEGMEKKEKKKRERLSIRAITESKIAGKKSKKKKQKAKKAASRVNFFAWGRAAEVSTDATVVHFDDRSAAMMENLMTTGTYMMEIRVMDCGSIAVVGVAVEDHLLHFYPGDQRGSWALCSDGDLLCEGDPTDHHKQWNDGDRIKVVYNADKGTLEWWRNGVQGRTVKGIDPANDGVCFCVGGRRGTVISMIQPGSEDEEEGHRLTARVLKQLAADRTSSFAVESPESKTRFAFKVKKLDETPKMVGRMMELKGTTGSKNGKWASIKRSPTGSPKRGLMTKTRSIRRTLYDMDKISSFRTFQKRKYLAAVQQNASSGGGSKLAPKRSGLRAMTRPTTYSDSDDD